jgi:hypothetical protein
MCVASNRTSSVGSQGGAEHINPVVAHVLRARLSCAAAGSGAVPRWGRGRQQLRQPGQQFPGGEVGLGRKLTFHQPPSVGKGVGAGSPPVFSNHLPGPPVGHAVVAVPCSSERRAVFWLFWGNCHAGRALPDCRARAPLPPTHTSGCFALRTQQAIDSGGADVEQPAFNHRSSWRWRWRSIASISTGIRTRSRPPQIRSAFSTTLSAPDAPRTHDSSQTSLVPGRRVHTKDG